MPYYYTCPLCGANLDPGEKCDCTITLTPPKNHNENKEDNTNVGNQSKNRST